MRCLLAAVICIIVPMYGSALAKSELTSTLTADNGVIIQEQSSGIIRPIASLTKLMLGILVSEQDLNEMLPIPHIRNVSSSIPRNTLQLTRYNLLVLSLMKSDNFASQILCGHLDNCISRMNEKASEIKMVDTLYTDPTGLDRHNVSTARDMLRLVSIASRNQVVSDISKQSSANIITDNRTIKVHNTNPLTLKYNIVLSKTGFTNPAGGCIVMVVDSDSRQRTYILLGSKNTRTRIADMEKLVKSR